MRSYARMHVLVLLFLVAVIFTHICDAVLPQYIPAVAIRGQDPRTPTRDELLREYFSCGFTHTEMQTFLLIVHGIQIRETTRLALNILDHAGVSGRRRRRLIRRKYHCKGPNYLWHIDGYDKLKPFGFCIHGAIDGYSRRIIWLEVASTNNDPSVVAEYFVDSVQQLAGTPRIVRADNGTENGVIAGMQRYFRCNCNDAFAGDKSFMYGRSVSNQRIEAWWSFLRKSNADWWINFFKDLRESGLFRDSDPVHFACLQFCFMPLLQNELHRIARHWNTHRIRPYPNQETPPGKPDVLFFLPEHKGTVDYKTLVDQDDLDIATYNFCTERNQFGCKDVFGDVFQMLMQENNLSIPTTVDEAETLYLILSALLQDII